MRCRIVTAFGAIGATGVCGNHHQVRWYRPVDQSGRSFSPAGGPPPPGGPSPPGGSAPPAGGIPFPPNRGPPPPGQQQQQQPNRGPPPFQRPQHQQGGQHPSQQGGQHNRPFQHQQQQGGRPPHHQQQQGGRPPQHQQGGHGGQHGGRPQQHHGGQQGQHFGQQHRGGPPGGHHNQQRPQQGSSNSIVPPAPAAAIQASKPAAKSAAEDGEGDEGEEGGDEDEIEGEEEDDSTLEVREVPPPEVVKVVVLDHRGETVPVQPLKVFEHIYEDIPEWLARGIHKTGYTKPMPVQATAIPLLMEGRDVIGIAPTGAGKTVAFAIPALGNVELHKSIRKQGKAYPFVVVLCPTRELVQQTHKVFIGLSGGGPRVETVMGGTDRETQKQHVCRGADIVIAAPGRLCDFLDDGCISMEKVNFLVLDEADRMLELGFAPQLAKIMSMLEKHNTKRVTMMWSATWSDQVGSLAKSFLNPNRLTINVEGDGMKANKNIEQRVYFVPRWEQRIEWIVDLYRKGTIQPSDKVIIFCKRRFEIQELTTKFAAALGFPEDIIQGLHGTLKQGKRSAIIRRFKEGGIRVLVATDIAARGLDVPNVHHVINYDLPLLLDSYVHRIGRTGRAGNSGMAHTLICRNDGSQIVADLGEYYKTNEIKCPSDLEQQFRWAKNRNVGKKQTRYKDHSSIDGDLWRTRGKDPGEVKPSMPKMGSGKAPNKGFQGFGGGGGPAIPPAPPLNVIPPAPPLNVIPPAPPLNVIPPAPPLNPTPVESPEES